MQKQLKLPAAAFKDNTLSRVDQQGGSVLFFHYSLVCIEGNLGQKYALSSTSKKPKLPASCHLKLLKSPKKISKASARRHEKLHLT